MPPIPGMMHWHSLLARHAKSLKAAFQKATKVLDTKLAGQQQASHAQLEPILIRNTPRQPTHPLARIRQSQSRWYSTARGSLESTVRHFSTGRSGVKYDRSSFPLSRVSSSIRTSAGRAPFASTLRPNLTGGTLGRTAGGYSLGGGRVGGARYFSHGPASQAQVVQNVSQAVRAFFISGQKAQYDGLSAQGGKRYKAVTALQEETGRKLRTLPKATPGSWIDFHINPTITALTPLAGLTGFSANSAIQADHLNTEGLLDVLSVDFSRALKELAAVLNNLKRLSALGDLPITYQDSSIRVHFPGCDGDTVESLCDELNVSRGIVVQDEAFDGFVGTEIALLFPFAPSTDGSDCESLFETQLERTARNDPLISLQDMLTPSESAKYSTQSDTGFEDVLAQGEEEAWLSPASGYESVRSGSEYGDDKQRPLEYQGFEGIYRFIEQCDSARR